MSGTSTLATSFSAVAAKDQTDADPAARYQDCLACRPRSIVGKRIMAGLGVCFLVASAMRWTK
ncbi:uncharacterized protein LAESUDRAFT_731290 [Laetiporus sulphureus 93-53]|uniref:DUF4536 domain-containing protein n=1 Tax=Laetiporus sulphureus 93-53 TaxID=1314785 RepID=A0A165BM93_9APHY|nr:uncharacterized protein LAESUDRAFT_731290 [Laetiporus sulphureus 93-53]KZT01304.1 hypothetical protein LAESUDRAFT_731290 [Laetiporus sulphureus 93-53]